MHTTQPYNSRGFSLVELLVVVAFMSLVMTMVALAFVTQSGFVQDQIQRIEAQQALRAVTDSLSRDLRLSGACLPTNGTVDFIPLGGVDGASSTDTIVTRTGLVQQPNLTCMVGQLVNTTNSNASSFQVMFYANEASFPTGGVARAYITSSTPGGGGEFFAITGAGGTTTVSGTVYQTLQKSTSWATSYPASSAVYAIDERIYKIDNSNPSLPVLTLQTNQGAVVPFAYGITGLNLQYQLNQNCTSADPPVCDTVNLPANDAQWALVQQVLLTVTARSRNPNHAGQYFQSSANIRAKPRNLQLPG